MFTIIDPITKGTFETEAPNVTAAVRYWLSCQRTWRESRDTDRQEDITSLIVRRNGNEYAIPIVRMP